MQNAKRKTNVSPLATIENHFPKQNTTTVNCTLSTVNSERQLDKSEFHSQLSMLNFTIPDLPGKGEVTSVCTLCAAVFVAQEPEKNGVHAMQQTVLRAATCTEEGSARNTCTRCGHEENEILPLAEHDYKTTYIKKPTCIKKGKKYQQCRKCGAEQVIELSPSSKYHKWVDGGNPQHCAYCFIFGPV